MKNLIWVTLAFFAYRAFFSERWHAVMFPHRSHPMESSDVGTYTSLQACKDASRAALNALPRQGDGAFECGRNCAGVGSSGHLEKCNYVTGTLDVDFRPVNLSAQSY